MGQSQKRPHLLLVWIQMKGWIQDSLSHIYSFSNFPGRKTKISMTQLTCIFMAGMFELVQFHADPNKKNLKKNILPQHDGENDSICMVLLS